MKIRVPSPVTAIFIGLCVIGTLVRLYGGWPYMTSVSTSGVLDLTHWYFYTGFFLHTLGHASWAHFFSNMALMIAVGPAVETMIGSKNLIKFIAITTVSVSIVNLIISDYSAIGASGIVFGLMMISSTIDMTNKTLPLCTILAVGILLGKEVYMSLQPDKVAQFAHIVGGILGIYYAWYLTRKCKGKEKIRWGKKFQTQTSVTSTTV